MASRPPTRSPLPRLVNTQTAVLDTHNGRVLCIADIRGHLSVLNDFARDNNAVAIIHTGDFGFFDAASLDPNGINDRTLRHLASYTPFVPSAQRDELNQQPIDSIRSLVNISLLSEFPLLLSGQIKLRVPVYTVWGACEDVRILEKFRQGTYAIDNLHVLDEATTRCIQVGGVKLRLLGLGGALVPHKMFDNGDGHATIAGGQGTMWVTALQIGELVDTSQRVYDNTETRVLVTHASPGREGIIAQLALVVKADITISAGLHFRYATSYNEFSVQGDYEGFRHKIMIGKQGFDRVWESVRPQVEAVMDDHQKILMDKALSVVERVPPVLSPSQPAHEEPAWKNCWNWNLCDAAYGSLVLDVKDGRISAELKSQGFNFAYRRTAATAQTPSQPNATLPPSNMSQGPTTVPTPVPAAAPDTTRSTPPPAAATTDKDSPSAKVNGANTAAEKAEREKAKKKEKKERKEREKAEKEKEKKDEKEGGTPQSTNAPVLPESGSGAIVSSDSGLKSPVTETGSSGVRTPKTGKPPRHPWTIFMRMPNGFSATDAEMKEFFGEAGNKIMKIHWPTPNPHFGHRAKIAYVDFEDEESMRTGLEKHAEKLNDIVPHVMQATDKETREAAAGRGTMRGRGRGGGAYAARGFAAAGLTRGGFNKGGNGGDAAAATQAPAPAPAPET
ncbi:hypothetical protein C0995_007961 [Termitomyces sp. Mi166|nr:hypothetical protein C0995_007961 [Termitomyces sp. Mi166\